MISPDQCQKCNPAPDSFIIGRGMPVFQGNTASCGEAAEMGHQEYSDMPDQAAHGCYEQRDRGTIRRCTLLCGIEYLSEDARATANRFEIEKAN